MLCNIEDDKSWLSEGVLNVKSMTWLDAETLVSETDTSKKDCCH